MNSFTEDKVRIAAVSFHDDAKLEFNLEQYKSKENVQQVSSQGHSFLTSLKRMSSRSVLNVIPYKSKENVKQVSSQGHSLQVQRECPAGQFSRSFLTSLKTMSSRSVLIVIITSLQIYRECPAGQFSPSFLTSLKRMSNRSVLKVIPQIQI